MAIIATVALLILFFASVALFVGVIWVPIAIASFGGGVALTTCAYRWARR